MWHITISNERFVVTGVGKNQDRIHINEEISLLVTRIAENALCSNKIANRYGAPRPPMTDVGTETAFRLDQRKHFQKSKHPLRSEVSWFDLHLRRSTCSLLVSRSINMLSVTDLSQKESFPGSEFKPASIWTCWMQIDRQMQSAFLPELHRWISKLTARHLQLACPPGDLLITMVKETVILYKKEFRKMKTGRISHWSERDENAKWLRDCLWLCQACKRGFTCRPM